MRNRAVSINLKPTHFIFKLRLEWRLSNFMIYCNTKFLRFYPNFQEISKIFISDQAAVKLFLELAVI